MNLIVLCQSSCTFILFTNKVPFAETCLLSIRDCFGAITDVPWAKESEDITALDSYDINFFTDSYAGHPMPLCVPSFQQEFVAYSCETPNTCVVG